MSQEHKRIIDDISRWLTRLIIAFSCFLLTRMYNRFEAMEESLQRTTTENAVLKTKMNGMDDKITSLENQVKDFSEDFNLLFRNYDLRPKK